MARKKMTSHQFDGIVKECFITNKVMNDKQFRTDKYKVYLTDDAFQKLVKGNNQTYNVQINALGLGYSKDPFISKFAKELGASLPKMYSIASSSRLCFMYIRDHNGIKRTVDETLNCCEELLKFPIDGHKKTTANLDVKIGDVYYECKCHEIFDSHEKLKFSSNYTVTINREFFGSSRKDSATSLKWFDFLSQNKTSLSYHFDLKQFICHLLGIANKVITDGPLVPNSTLQYIFFRPSCANIKCDNPAFCRSISQLDTQVYPELEAEVKAIFAAKSIQDFCNKYYISLAAKYVMLPNFADGKVIASYPAKQP